MKFRSTGTDRKPLIEELEKATGMKRTYMGPPTFRYEVGEYTILRDGSVEVSDVCVDMDLIRSLIVKGMLEKEVEEEALSIDIPLEGESPQTLMNLLNMIHSRQFLLNQSVGRPGAFHIDEKAREKLELELPRDVAGFEQKMQETGSDKFKGILLDDKIHFCGFPRSDDPDRVRAYMDLAELMVKSAKAHERVKAQSVNAVNQKYSFRVWLMSIGMKGDRYKNSRRVLLHNLTGNSSFRTPEQKENYQNHMREKREREKEQKCLEFIPL